MTLIGLNADALDEKNYSFKKIKEASTHLLGVINNILDMSKIEAGKLELSETTFRLRDVIYRVSDVMRFKTNENNQLLENVFADNLPEAVLGDDLRLAQVLTNLVGNAVKFTPEGGKITVSVFCDEVIDGLCELRFLVSDTGIGMTPEQQSKLFQSFQQAENTTTRKYGGTGLGLALSKQIIELMGGEIWVDSIEGKGSTFGFTVVMTQAEASDAALAEEDVEIEAIPGELRGKRILLAEDVEINCEILITLLEDTEAEIVTAENGKQACDLFINAQEPFDLILMDVQMPEMDGYDASRHIREHGGPHGAVVPIVAMTANVFKEDIERCIEAGMNAHLGKPIEFNKLMLTLRRYLC
jgi:CheY-like chemotaxis protein